MKTFHHLLDNNNIIFKSLYFFITFFYIIYCFRSNSYEIIFIDERLIIDDIYNIWLLDDYFNRFSNINNGFLKSLLIIATETSYGGDLRYGRLWSNIFTLLIGPFTFFSDAFVITSSRLLNLFFLNLSFYFLSKTFIQKKYFWLSMLALLSLPGVEFLIRIPKPDVLALLFVSLGLLNYKNNKYSKSIFFLLIASFLKINFIIILLIFFLKIFLSTHKKIAFLVKSIGLSLMAIVIVNPVLIIPPLRLFDTQLPNFYLKYFEWIFSQGNYGQDEVFSYLFFQKWLETINIFYLVPKQVYFIVSCLIAFLLVFISITTYKNNISYSKLFLIIFFVYMFFYMFFIERQFLWYINTPFIFLALSIFINYDPQNNILKRFTFFLLFFLIIGNVSNISNHHKNKLFSANYKLGYEQINNEEQAVALVDKVLANIKQIYLENKSLGENKVYWNPNLFIPRNNVTYVDNFFVREYWGPDDLSIILSEADIYVTNEDLEPTNFKKIKVENYYIYYK